MELSYEEQFKNELYKKYSICKKKLWPKEKYFEILDKMKAASNSKGDKGRNAYYLLSKYEILHCGDVEKLIKKRNTLDESPLYLVHIEDTYDVIKKAHMATGHGGRDRMITELSKKYLNITVDAITIFKSYCVQCQKKRKRPRTKGIVIRPILTDEFSSRGQMDLIDMQSMANKLYKWILVYQDHLTKFVILKALTSKRACEVANHLLDIFLLIGAPSILQSDNGSEFTATVINELKLVWPRLHMVHGKPRHPQSQGSVERANGDIKDMLISWMGDNASNNWAVGIKFVQFQKNSSLNSGIQMSPYNAMFGCEAKVGLSTSVLPSEIIARMQSEDDLMSLNTNLEVDAVSNSVDEEQDIPEVSEFVIELPSDISVVVPISSDSEITASKDLLSSRISNICEERTCARSSQKKQAERMVKRSRLELVSGEVGDNVAVPIPNVDRGRGDPRNILGVIVDIDENNMYTISVKAGILKGKYLRNQFDLCPQRLLKTSDVNQNITISLRQAVCDESSSGGQGFVRCNCAGSKRCQTNRCKCYKNKIKCSSRCHSSLTCKHK